MKRGALLQRLSEANPVTIDDLGDTSRTAEGEALLARLLADPPEPSGPGLPKVARPARPTARRLVSGLTAAAIAGALAATVPALLPSGGPAGASPAAAAVLTRAARAVTAETSARPDQYWRIETRGTQVASGQTGSGWDSVVVEQRTVDWVPVDGRRRMFSDRSQRTIRVLGSDLSLEEARRLFPAVEETLAFGPIFHPSWDAPTPQWLAELPRDPTALRDRLYADSAGRGNSPDGEALVYATDLLRAGLAPADLRASLYEVLKTIPGMEVTEEDATVMGRPGVALGRLEPTTGERQEIIVDPRTSEFVGARQTSSDGLVTETTVVRTLVDEVPPDVRHRAATE